MTFYNWKASRNYVLYSSSLRCICKLNCKICLNFRSVLVLPFPPVVASLLVGSESFYPKNISNLRTGLELFFDFEWFVHCASLGKLLVINKIHNYSNFWVKAHLTALVLEPDSDNSRTESGHLNQLFFHESVGTRIRGVARF